MCSLGWVLGGLWYKENQVSQWRVPGFVPGSPSQWLRAFFVPSGRGNRDSGWPWVTPGAAHIVSFGESLLPPTPASSSAEP